MSRRGSRLHPAGDRPGTHDSHTAPKPLPFQECAGVGRRLASLLYEGLVLLAILFCGSALVTAAAGPADSLPTRLILQGLLLTLPAGYFVWCWTRSGQTLPMQAWKLRLVDASTGKPPSLSKALKRYLIAIPGTLFAGASFLWVVFDRDGLFLHDRLTGTTIVRVTRER
ncbi:MAG: RDD family protein [Burkholderiales bacterium]